MHLQFNKPTGRALLAATVALVCVPAAASARPIDAVAGHDLRSPDPRAAALAQERYYSSYARPAGPDGTLIVSRRDMRSPDTRDIAEGRKYPSTPTVVTLREVRPPEATSSGFDWTAATAGAGAALGVILMAAAGVLLNRRRTHEPPVAVS